MTPNIQHIKQELETTSKQFWNIDKYAGELLQSLIFTHQPKEILEIGTSNGYSAILMAEIASQYDGHITTIEFFDERVKLATDNIARAGLSDTITILQGDAVEILRNFSPSYEGEPACPAGRREGVASERRTPTPALAGTPPYPRGRNARFDLIFLDANKEEYALYFQHALQLLQPNGIIVADNTISHAKKLTEFFAAVQHEPRARALALTIGTGLMIIRIV